MCVHRDPRGPLRCSTPLFSAHDGCCHVSSATGEPFWNRWIVAGLAPQDDLGAPWVDEGTTEAVELAPVVIAPQNGGAARLGSFEDAVLVVVVGDQDVHAGTATAGQVGVGIARGPLGVRAAVGHVVDPHV